MTDMVDVTRRPRGALSALLAICQPQIPRLRNRDAQRARSIYYKLDGTDGIVAFLSHVLPWFGPDLAEQLAARAIPLKPGPGDLQ